MKQAIIKVGHDAEDLKATNEDYDKLHGCLGMKENKLKIPITCFGSFYS